MRIGWIVGLATVSALITGCLCSPCTVTQRLRSIQGSGVLVTTEMNLSGFTALEIENAFEVDVLQSETYSVVITVDDNLEDELDVYKKGTTLHIGLKANISFQRGTLRARITMPDLDKLELSGASRGSMTGFRSSGDFVLDVSGASSLEGELTKAGDARFVVSGASKVTLAGSAETLKLNASGASKANLGDFAVGDADVVVSGASSALVNVRGRLDANVSGASVLEHRGNPQMGNIKTSGASTLKAQ